VTSHTFLFADLCGFTDYTRRHGDEFAARLAVRFHDRAGELAAEEGCELVKSIGDAVMVRAEDCRDALRLAARILALTERERYPPIRVGIDCGPAVPHRGDWFGATVNAAARITEAASPGGMVLTERASLAAVDRDAERVLGGRAENRERAGRPAMEDRGRDRVALGDTSGGRRRHRLMASAPSVARWM